MAAGTALHGCRRGWAGGKPFRLPHAAVFHKETPVSPSPGLCQETCRGFPRQQQVVPAAVNPVLPCPAPTGSAPAAPSPAQSPPNSSSTRGVPPLLLILLLPLVSRCFQDLWPKWCSRSKDTDRDKDEVRAGAGASSAPLPAPCPVPASHCSNPCPTGGGRGSAQR